jgi:hypothetical protein
MKLLARLRGAPAFAAAMCAGLAAMDEARPAAASFVSFLALLSVVGRRWALLLCAGIALGLMATEPLQSKEGTSRDRAPAHHHRPASS